MSLDNFQCDDLMEKLKMLNFERNLLKEIKIKPFSKFFFVKSINPGEQFYIFTLISWWLCKKMGKDIERPQESDDPNEFIAKIIQILEGTDIPVDFQPNKLISGAGPNCLFVLNALAEKALRIAEMNYQRPQIAVDEEEKIEYFDENVEIILENLEHDQSAEQSDGSDIEFDRGLETPYDTTNLLNQKQQQHHHHHHHRRHRDRNSFDKELTSEQNWNLELERVLPKLKVIVKADTRDWRSHLAQMATLTGNMYSITDEAQVQLKKLHNDVTYTLDKVESREKHLNNELQSLIRQFKDVSIDLSNLQQSQKQIQKDTDNCLIELNKVVEENDAKKMEMEKRGQAMTDSSSVLQIKKAITKLKDEIAQLNLEVALIGNAIDQEIMNNHRVSEMSN